MASPDILMLAANDGTRYRLPREVLERYRVAPDDPTILNGLLVEIEPVPEPEVSGYVALGWNPANCPPGWHSAVVGGAWGIPTFACVPDQAPTRPTAAPYRVKNVF